MTASGSALATRPFLLLCLTMFLGCGSHWVLMPIISLYVQDLGGSAFTAGLVLLAFAIPSFTIRPLLGTIADRWSAAGVLALGLALLAAGAVVLFVPLLTMLFVGTLYARTLDIENIGLFYVLAGATNIVIRPLLGKKADAIGRGPAIAAGLVSQLIGLILILAADDITLILAGAVFFATGQSLVGSTTTALAMDLANPLSRGRAMASYSISYQIGAGAGAMLSGALADWLGLRGMYLGSVAIALAGFIVLASAWKAMPRPQRRGGS